ncbi:MAG: YceI family protein [Alphaproteobacteria bacterium]|nr:YceI family protein [Alphaproteobacteria bacterium]
MKRILLVALVGLLIAGPAVASTWTVVPEQSRLVFAGTQLGGVFNGEFRSFDAAIKFDPADPASSAIDVSVDVTSFFTGSSDRDGQAARADWFDFAKFPLASFTVKEVRTNGEAGFEAVADLSIRSITREVVLPFTFAVDGDMAKVDGEVTLDRTAYDVGIGQWSTEEVVAFPVKVTIDLVLQRAQ